MDAAEVGANIRTRRESRGLTQAELAAALGTSQKVVSHYETGHRAPSPDRLEALAAVLEVETDDLMAPVEDLAPRPRGRPTKVH